MKKNDDNKETLKIEEIDSLNQEVDAFSVQENDENKRLDLYVSEMYKDISRSYIQKLIKNSRILVNSKIEKPSYKVEMDDLIYVSMLEPKDTVAIPQDIKIDIIYEDEDVLIVNKPQGMVVHPAPGNPDNTLVNAALYHCNGNLSSVNGLIRPGIVHRIDKDTSGILVIAKNNMAHEHLAEQFKVHSITREYEMISLGNVKWDEMTVDKPIGRNSKNRLKMAVVNSGGKNAVTHFHLIERYSGYSYLRANLETGRTHQIRVHSSFLNHPILGDYLYGYKEKKFPKLKGQMLHARKLGFIHPRTGEYVEFSSELPEYFKRALEILREQ
ncbi:RluA family pseudouridine synthase [Peptostreptococcus faecalis]|uniref:RluA family pseudouridine synthase n=1 Tax=Peptostreptococcus faecalis TaxID=2045015 RepID=UPI000C7CCEC0|nr:RluA family pseudouridine synthase [Peptostreptococcus faecalis]